MTDYSQAPGQVYLSRLKEPITEEERELLLQLCPERMPGHIAIIMDGNGRWAKERGFLDRIRGHEAGIDSVRIAVRACGELHVKALTLYAFSMENWQRPSHEVSALMHLLVKFLHDEIPELNDNNVRLVASGALDELPEDAQEGLMQTCQATEKNSGLILNLALSYGGRAEILNAVKTIAAEVAAGRMRPEEITDETISASLYQPQVGDPDLLIRTSGEFRVSNFLLWQIAYTEIYVTSVLWPDFRRSHLYTAIQDFQRRERRFGKVLNA